jgi:hypothetical protein
MGRNEEISQVISQRKRSDIKEMTKEMNAEAIGDNPEQGEYSQHRKGDSHKRGFKRVMFGSDAANKCQTGSM